MINRYFNAFKVYKQLQIILVQTQLNKECMTFSDWDSLMDEAYEIIVEGLKKAQEYDFLLHNSSEAKFVELGKFLGDRHLSTDECLARQYEPLFTAMDKSVAQAFKPTIPLEDVVTSSQLGFKVNER